MKLLILVASCVAGASECLAGDAACNAGEVDDSALLSLRASSVKAPAPTPAPTPSVCIGTSKDNPCWEYESKAFLVDATVAEKNSGLCGDMREYTCDAASWVFCQNAVCSQDLKQDPISRAWYSECACWQQTSDNGNALQNVSMIPADSNSGANCVMGKQPGGDEMCNQMKAGKLWSTYGPQGSFLPGQPLRSAICEPHTPWVWCWGAPCERNKAGDIVCKCPLMISSNDAAQALTLPGDSLCTEDPCSGTMLNSMPAGFSEAAITGSCYNYSGQAA